MSFITSTRPFAVITGASKGIGAAYAQALATQGYDLLLVARNEQQLQAVAAEVTHNKQVCAEWVVLDLAKPSASHALYQEARQRREHVDLLINNAGWGLYGPFLEMPLPQIQNMMTVNMQTVVENVRLFLPGMVARRQGAIINVASVAGFFPLPYLAVYSSTKAFLNTFTAAISEEISGTGVTIQAFCPGKTKTNFQRTAGYISPDPMDGEDPMKVVQTSLAGLSRGSGRVTVGSKGMAMKVLAGVFPHALLTKVSGWFLQPKLPTK